MSYADLSICEDMNKVCIYMYAYEIGEDPSVKCFEGHIMYILKIFAALFRLCIFVQQITVVCPMCQRQIAVTFI